MNYIQNEKIRPASLNKKVNQILSGNEQGTDTGDFEREIDAMVYNLYGLTEEEIRIVEGEV